MRPRIILLGKKEIADLHDASCRILSQIGVAVPDEEIASLLLSYGAERKGGRLLLPQDLVEWALTKAGKEFRLYGRDGKKSVAFRQGEMVFCSSPGQFAWFEDGMRREPREEDLYQAIHLAHHLPHIDVVGGVAMPSSYPPERREIYMARELFVRTDKPIFLWFSSPDNFRQVFAMSEVLAGSREAAQEEPRLFAFLEPISPLRFSQEGLGILKEATSLKLPVMIGPMSQAGSTAPVTLAGTLAQENAEILAAIVITELLCPGPPICYGGIPHVFDPKTGSISFGSPEQGLLSLAMAEVGAFYSFPVYINVGLTDSCAFDPQNGWEKGVTLILGMLSGATTFGHMGIVGSDQGGSLEQLVLDNELIGFCKRILKGYEVSEETMDLTIVEEGVREGSFLALDRTVRFMREELWVPSCSFRGAFREGQGILSSARMFLEKIFALPLPLLDEERVRDLDAFLKGEG
ncbi:MAG: trimethylamine methyltransferase family protein [Candidatus Caldatribacteriaceae bacterium]